MVPILLELRNFLPYKRPDPLDFSGIHVACLVGRNGAGKSSLLEAMVWALWGRARDGKRSDDELIHFGEKEMRVAFTFDLGDERFQVIRQRKAGKRGQSVLALQSHDTNTQSWSNLSGTGIRQTQRKIDNLLHIDYETFVNSAFIAQGRADAFTVRSPGERKTVLANILGLEQWATYEQHAKEHGARLNEDIRVLEREIGTIDLELLRRSEYEQDLSNAELSLNQVLQKLRKTEKQMANVEQARRGLANACKLVDDLALRVHQSECEMADVDNELEDACLHYDPDMLASEEKATKKLLRTLEGCEAEYKLLSKQRVEAAENSAHLKGENDTLKREAGPIKRRIATLQTATEPVCPTCGEALDEKARGHLISALLSELEERRSRYSIRIKLHAEFDERASALQQRLDKIDSDLKEKVRLERRVAELESAAVKAAEVQKGMNGLQRRRKRWEDTLAQDRDKYENAQAEARKFELQLLQTDDHQQTLDRLRFEHRMATEQVGSERQKLAAMEGLAQRKESRRSELEKLTKQVGIYEELCLAFGKQGVPAMIIEAAVPEIEQTTNMLLGKMTGGRMNVRFDTQRELKSGDVRETLDIKISDELGTRNYELYSGGEGFRVNFAIRIALSKLLARRSGAQLQTIVIDEGFGTQDERGRDRLIEAINAIQDEFACVLVITHIEELKEAFPTRINVVKTSEGSNFSLI